MREAHVASDLQSRRRAVCFAGAAALALSGCTLLIFDSNSGIMPTSVTEDTEFVAVNDAGMKVAPTPGSEFRAQECSTEPSGIYPGLTPRQMSIPDHEIVTSFESRNDLSLPAAPKGIIYTDSAPLGADEGKTVTAGHVDYAPNVLSRQGGELSPWGYLHEVESCDSVYVSDEDGQIREYTITDKYVVGKDELEDSGVFAETGEHKLVMVTCSGESATDAGQDFQFSYDHNLVVEASEVLA